MCVNVYIVSHTKTIGVEGGGEVGHTKSWLLQLKCVCKGGGRGM